MSRDYVGFASIFLAPSYGTRRHGWADAIHLRAYEGKKVRISGALESPHVIVVRTFDAVD
jgi:hypothetical protein